MVEKVVLICGIYCLYINWLWVSMGKILDVKCYIDVIFFSLEVMYKK